MIYGCILLIVFFSRPALAQFVQGLESLGDRTQIERIELVLREIRDLTVPGLRRYTTTQGGILEIEQIPGDILRIEAARTGTTFLHYWDARGRHTIEFLVSHTPTLAGRRGAFQARGPKFAYLFRMTAERTPGRWRDPFYDHDFEAFVPLADNRLWRTTLRALTNPRVIDAPSYAPFSQATDLIYGNSNFRSRNWSITAGDFPYFAGDLSIQGMALRGGQFSWYKNKDRLQIFGGWSRPLFGDQRFWEITEQGLFGASGTKELLPNLSLFSSFAFSQDQTLEGITPIGSTSCGVSPQANGDPG